MIRLEIPILFLEYYASGGTVSCIECGYLEAKSFTNETNWYIGTFASDFWSNVHGLFFAVNGVGGFTNGHNNFGLTEGIGNGACIVIPYYVSADGFTKSTEWYEGTILSNVWSSVFHGDNLVVYNEVRGTDGHNNAGVSQSVFFTNGVFKSLTIESITISYSNNDVYSCFFVGEDGQFTFTVYCILSRNSNFCICVALICNVSIYFATYFVSEIAICINNAYSNSVIFVSVAFSWIECESIGVVCIYNSQFFFNILLSFAVISFYIDGSTNERFISNGVFCNLILIIETKASPISYNSLAIYAIFSILGRNLNTIFVDIFCFNFQIFTKCDFISDLFVLILSSTSCLSIHGYIQILNGTKFSNIESSSCIVATEQGQSYSVFTWNEIMFFIVANIFQSIVGTIPCKN